MGKYVEKRPHERPRWYEKDTRYDETWGWEFVGTTELQDCVQWWDLVLDTLNFGILLQETLIGHLRRQLQLLVYRQRPMNINGEHLRIWKEARVTYTWGDGKPKEHPRKHTHKFRVTTIPTCSICYQRFTTHSTALLGLLPGVTIIWRCSLYYQRV